MKLPSEARLLCLAVLALAALGFLIVRQSEGRGKPSAAAPEGQGTRTQRTNDGMTTTAEWMDRIQRAPATGRASLMRQILAISGEAQRNEVATALATVWMQEDIDGYLAFIDSMMIEEGISSEMMKRMAVAMRNSFEAVYGKQKVEGKVRYVAEQIVRIMIQNDLAGAEGWAREFLLGLDLDLALAKIAPALAGESPEKALAIFDSIQSPLPRLNAAAEIGAVLAKKDPAYALKWASSITRKTERSLAMASVAETIAKTDPSLAASSLKEFMQRIQAEYETARENDRKITGAKAESEFQSPEAYQDYLANGGAELPPASSPEIDYLLDAANRVAAELAKRSPMEALKWAESLPTGIAQAHAISGALTGWSETAPQAAVSYYLDQYGYDPLIPVFLFENWATLSTEAAVAGIAQLQNAEQRTSAIKGVTSGWLASEENLGGLIAWVDTLPAGKDRDDAKVEIISQTSEADPAAAWEMVLSITDPDIRRRAAANVFSTLAAESPESARTVLKNYQAPAEEIANLGKILAMVDAK